MPLGKGLGGFSPPTFGQLGQYFWIFCNAPLRRRTANKNMTFAFAFPAISGTQTSYLIFFSERTCPRMLIIWRVCVQCPHFRMHPAVPVTMFISHGIWTGTVRLCHRSWKGDKTLNTADLQQYSRVQEPQSETVAVWGEFLIVFWACPCARREHGCPLEPRHGINRLEHRTVLEFPGNGSPNIAQSQWW